MESGSINPNEITVQAIIDVISADDRINWPEADIRVFLRDHTVVLLGTVARLADKRRAEIDALKVKGVEDADNKLLVETIPARADEEIQKHVYDALEEDPWIDNTRIRVSVEGGIVTLAGEAESLVRKRLIGATAWWIPGVREVMNNLTVVHPEQDNDDQILDACETVLEKDPFVDETEVLTRVHNGVVTLLGSVCSEGEREMAEDDCWYILGVRDIINCLAVVPQAGMEQSAS